MNKVSVLVLIESLDRAGVETVIMNYIRNIDKDKVEFGFLVNGDKKTAYEAEIELMGYKIYHMCKLNSSGYKNEFINFLRKHPEYEVIHSYLEDKGMAALAAAKELLIPARIVHAYSNANLKDLLPSKKKNLAAFTTDFLASNELAAKRLFGVANMEEVQYVRNAIDVVTFQFHEKKEHEIRKELGICEDAFVISCIGRFAKEKNQSFVLDIFDELKEVKKAVLLFVGEGRNKKESRYMNMVVKKAERLGMTDRVKFLGSRDDVDKILAATDVMLMPSKNETITLTLLEAQAAAAKSVVTDTVSDECIVIPDAVEKVSIKKPARAWACKVMDFAYNNKKMISAEEQLKIRDKESFDNCTKMLREGYDIIDNAKKLQKIYEDSVKILAD